MLSAVNMFKGAATDILQGLSSQGVKFRRKILASYDK